MCLAVDKRASKASKQTEVPSKSVVTCKKLVAPLLRGRWIGRAGKQSKIVEIIVKDGFAGQIVDKQTIQPDQWLWPASQCNELFTIQNPNHNYNPHFTINNSQSTICDPHITIQSIVMLTASPLLVIICLVAALGHPTPIINSIVQLNHSKWIPTEQIVCHRPCFASKICLNDGIDGAVMGQGGD